MNDPKRVVPLSSLQTHLEGQSLVSMIHRGEAREYHRTWGCGCTAIYRETAHHTARWRPCHQHAAIRPAASSAVRSGDAVPKSLSAAGRRTGPQFLLLDEALNVLAASSGEEMPDLIRRAIATAPYWLPIASVVPLDDDVLIRVIPLAGPDIRKTIVFFENVRGRGGLPSLAKRFDLTNREIDVLRLLTSSRSNAEIARELSIAQSTVGDHVKSIFRKTNCTRRTQILTKVFDSSD